MPPVEVVKIDNGVYEIYIKTTSRVVSFKVKSDILRRFDLLIREYNLGSRSRVLNKLVEALTKALENVGKGSLTKISLNVEYVDEDGETKNITVALIP